MRSNIAVVAIAASAGGLEAMCQILSRLPVDFPAPVFYYQHLNGSSNRALVDVLQWCTPLKVSWAHQGDRIMAGGVYVCPPGCSAFVHPCGTVTLTRTVTALEVLHGADHLFASVAASYGPRALAIVLSGGGSDGSNGIYAIRAHGGTVLVQDESSASHKSMPQSAIATSCANLIVPLRHVAPALVSLVRDSYPLAALQANASRLIGDRMTSVPRDLRSVLDALLAIALRVRATDLGNIQLFDQQTGNLVIVTQRGFGLDFLDHFNEVNCQDDSACGRALRCQEPVLIPDVRMDPLFAEHRAIAAAAGFRAVQSVPLISRKLGLLGILSTHFRNPLDLSEETQQQLRSQQRTTHLVAASLLAPFHDLSEPVIRRAARGPRSAALAVRETQNRVPKAYPAAAPSD